MKFLNGRDKSTREYARASHPRPPTNPRGPPSRRALAPLAVRAVAPALPQAARRNVREHGHVTGWGISLFLSFSLSLAFLRPGAMEAAAAAAAGGLGGWGLGEDSEWTGEDSECRDSKRTRKGLGEDSAAGGDRPSAPRRAASPRAPAGPGLGPGGAGRSGPAGRGPARGSVGGSGAGSKACPWAAKMVVGLPGRSGRAGQAGPGRPGRAGPDWTGPDREAAGV